MNDDSALWRHAHLISDFHILLTFFYDLGGLDDGVNDDSGLWRHAHLISVFLYFVDDFYDLGGFDDGVLCKWKMGDQMGICHSRRITRTPFGGPTTELEDQMGIMPI